MRENPKERRAAPRFAMRLLALARFSNGSVYEEETFTQDVSAGGAFFYVNREIGGRREVELILVLPSEGETPTDIRVRYTGRVVRLERSPEGRVGVAAALGSCEYLAQA